MAAKPGERKLQILQTIAEMLENPAGEKVTTALLAAKLGISEAALYRHFASKAQMYEGLIEFIENGIFSVLNQIGVDEESGMKQVELSVATALRFSHRNRGLTRVMIGDALVNENPRLQLRINQLTDRIEATLKQSLRIAVTQGALPAEHDVGSHAAILVNYIIGRWHRFAKSGFRNDPMEQWPQHWLLLQR